MDEEIEDLRLHRHEGRAPVQLAAIRVERTVVE
jgi:hypothetical protein